MNEKRKRHSARFKFQVALEAAKGTKTINQLASEYEPHPNQVSLRKKQLLEEAMSVFSSSTAQQQREQETREAESTKNCAHLKAGRIKILWADPSKPRQRRKEAQRVAAQE